MMEKKRFLDFLDRFDGGGAGQMGDKFEGGGLLSAIGNAFGSPYGSEDPERMAARQAFYNSENIGGGPVQTPSPVGTVGGGAPTRVAPPTYEQRVNMNPPAAYTPPPAPSPLEMFGGMDPAPYSPAPKYSGQGNFGSNMNPTNAYNEGDPMERFSRQMIDMLGLDEAQRLMSTDMGAQAYKVFVENGYNMPNY